MTKTIATRYRRADKAGKGAILDELCATTGWHRNPAPQGPGARRAAEGRPCASASPADLLGGGGPIAYFVATHDRSAESRVIHDEYGSIAAFVTAHNYGPDHPDGDGPRAPASPR